MAKPQAACAQADNVSHTKIAGIRSELSKYGTPNIRRADGDWTSKQLTGWTGKLHQHALRPIQQFSYSAGKNATDISLMIDAMELPYTHRLDAFAIASNDADFTPLVMHLRAVGPAVYGFGERKTSEPFSAAKRQAPINPRNYGVKNFPALFAATGHFDIVKGADNQAFVADKRTERTPQTVD